MSDLAVATKEDIDLRQLFDIFNIHISKGTVVEYRETYSFMMTLILKIKIHEK